MAIDDIDDGVIAGKSGTVISHHNDHHYNTTVEFDEKVRNKWDDVVGHRGYWTINSKGTRGKDGFCYNMKESNLEFEYILTDFAAPDIKLLFGGE